MSSFAVSQDSGFYPSLVSFDIKSTFDNVEWRDILLQLIAINYSGNLGGIIGSYLSLRSVLINWGTGASVHLLEEGCPQGSCQGPILWLIIANVILKDLHKLGFLLGAFADDFSFFQGSPALRPWYRGTSSTSCFPTAADRPSPLALIRKISSTHIRETHRSKQQPHDTN